MSQKNNVVKTSLLPSKLFDSADELLEVTPSRNPELSGQLVQQVADTLWIPTNTTSKEQMVIIRAAIAAVREIKPQDGAESLLATQMVATHNAAMDWMRRSARPGESVEAADLCLRQANKLLSLYLKQLDALNRNRYKGQQKVTVEHRQSGGQAIVGNVQLNAKK